ncbi:MAG: NAD-dependent epimerase/dehydratase family protein [Gammaproteobacteria bacterium]|nr:NAD-dependent epimerase/dehydratase family protein [Gammaproteobacteria bacterium]
MAQVLVTGGSGFIGSNLITALLQQGREVYALTRRPLAQHHPRLHEVRGDLFSTDSYRSQLGEVDTIFHCAGFISFSAEDDNTCHQINVEGTEALLTAVLQCGSSPRFVHLSACAVFGFLQNGDGMLDERAAPSLTTASGYARSKQEAERVVLQGVAQGLDGVIANISTVYGAGDHRLNSGSVIRSVLSGMRLIPPGGSSYIAMPDLISGLLALAAEGRSGERYILNGENLSYRSLITRIAAVTGAPKPWFALPELFRGPAVAAAWLLQQLPRRGGGVNLITPQIIRETFGYKYFSNNKAVTELGWRPCHTLESAVDSALTYYRQQGLLP